MSFLLLNALLISYVDGFELDFSVFHNVSCYFKRQKLRMLLLFKVSINQTYKAEYLLLLLFLRLVIINDGHPYQMEGRGELMICCFRWFQSQRTLKKAISLSFYLSPKFSSSLFGESFSPVRIDTSQDFQIKRCNMSVLCVGKTALRGSRRLELGSPDLKP